MRARLVTSYLVLVLVALVLFTVPVAARSASLLERTLQETATREARLFVPLVLRDDPAAAQSIRDRTRDFQDATGSRVRLVRAGEDTGGDPQVEAALAGRAPGPRWGRSDLLGAEAVSVVVPATRDGRVVAVVQIVAPAAEVRAEIRDIWFFRVGVGIAVLLVAGLLAVFLAGTLSRPLRRLTDVARTIGEGRLDARAEETGPPEIAALAVTLNRTAHRTEVLLASQRSFVADASHQLRTPLTAMRLCLDNVRETTQEPAAQAQLRLVDDEIRRMGRMVEGLLHLARAEGPAPASEEVELSELVEDRLSLWAAAGEDTGVQLTSHVPAGLGVFVGRGSLEQVLDNLLDNALVAAPADTEIVMSVSELSTGWVQLSVRDHGPGLAPGQHERAFDRFWSTRTGGGGSGLGLAVVKQLVEKDDGRVRLLDAPGGGLDVRIDLRRVVRRGDPRVSARAGLSRS